MNKYFIHYNRMSICHQYPISHLPTRPPDLTFRIQCQNTPSCNTPPSPVILAPHSRPHLSFPCRGESTLSIMVDQ